MSKYFKNPFVWVGLAFVCYLVTLFVSTAWVSLLFAVIGIAGCLVAGKLLDNHLKSKKDKKKKKLSMLSKGMYASIIIMLAMCVSTLSSVFAPICWCVAFGVFVWYLYERVQDYMKEVARSKRK